ncbi:MAG: ParB N-terminal domain-containing protein [Pseudomonadales bacterium]
MSNNKKPNMRAFRSLVLAKTSNAEDNGHATRASARPLTGTLHAPSMSEPRKERQVYYLKLPVSGGLLKCELVEFDPDELVVSPYNQRSQELLDDSNPKVLELRAKMLSEGQNVPALVRLNRDDQPELIYGSRRRFVLSSINKKERKTDPIKLTAWFHAKVPDVDARRLSHSENDDREAISPWERGQYFLRLKQKNPELTGEAIAALAGEDPKLISKYLQLATLPTAVVKLVASPVKLTLGSGLDIHKALRKFTHTQREEMMASIGQGVYFESGAELLRVIKGFVAKKAAVTTKKKIEFKDCLGKKRAVIGVHRSNKGQYKVDLYGFDDEQMGEIKKAIKKIVGS